MKKMNVMNNQIINCPLCGCTYIKNDPSERVSHGYRHKKILTYNNRHAGGPLWPIYLFETERENETRTAQDILCKVNSSKEEKFLAAITLFRIQWIESFESVLLSKSLPKTLGSHPNFPSYLLLFIKAKRYDENLITAEITDWLVEWAEERGGRTEGIRWKHRGGSQALTNRNKSLMTPTMIVG
ncbi:hypothetical protein [Aneurinibacillus tyrosinisolvens]|uniref:hypothetical protein n=1 Tax=Aneurinibacillus tyrosinisolvens TaxID=1443435 RepID=UPI00063F6863|nr:hypothetical protein [Aneurinibacillus tyrosinisolvens]